jgi:hypothetical protein
MGPIQMFDTLCSMWIGRPIEMCNSFNKYKRWEIGTPSKIAHIVITFFDYYGVNRNKMTILTPSVHGTDYSPDDNRHNLRPFLLPRFKFTETAKLLRKRAEYMESEGTEKIRDISKENNNTPAENVTFSNDVFKNKFLNVYNFFNAYNENELKLKIKKWLELSFDDAFEMCKLLKEGTLSDVNFNVKLTPDPVLIKNDKSEEENNKDLTKISRGGFKRTLRKYLKRTKNNSKKHKFIPVKK